MLQKLVMGLYKASNNQIQLFIADQFNPPQEVTIFSATQPYSTLFL